MADKGLELERRRLRAKSNVKIFVAMQDDAAANRSLSVCIWEREVAIIQDDA